MSTYWMRWLDFSRLPPLFAIVDGTPGQLKSGQLEDAAVEQGSFRFPSGKPIGKSNRYHHRMALERFGLVIKAEGRYYPNLVTEQRDAMLVAADDGALTQEQRIILADRVITNADCYDVFWSNFCPNMRPTSVDQFVASAGAILLRIEESSQFKGRYSTSVLLRGPASVRPYVLHEGYSAVQAIHFGMRRWGIEQLRFLDELYQVGHGHHIFPIDVRRVPDGETIDQNLFAHLEFNGDWAMPRVGDLLLTTASKMKIPIASVRDRLQSWLTLFRGFVSPVRVSERMILEGRSKRIWELSLSGFLTPPGGGVISHLKVHRGILPDQRL